MSKTYPVIKLEFADAEIVTFSKTQIIRAVLVEEINAVGSELPISTLEFKVLDESHAFSMFAGSSYEMLLERLPVMAYEYVDDIPRFLGKF
ncbi:MAG: hypothetical protein ABIK07_09010, partial [Planctomycetota bacterium]